MDWIDYDQHARTRPRDDLWGQVRRTVRGQPVGAEQIDLIVATVVQLLQLGGGDTLLDLACGNGALSAQLQGRCRASLGVDISPYLVDVARERFETEAHHFIVDDIANYAETGAEPERFTKALCYGSLSYLSDADVARMLRALRSRFPNLRRVMLGNLPDPARVGAFHAEPLPELGEPRSAIGVWRSPSELARLAGDGWTLSTSNMPATFFAAHYRFDALLERRP
jgi:SAM-dependent methyltransferase